MLLSQNAQKYSSRRIGLRGPLLGGQDGLLPPPKARCQRPIALAATCRKYGPPAAILLLQARPRYCHSAKSAVLHKNRQRGTATPQLARSRCTCQAEFYCSVHGRTSTSSTKFSVYMSVLDDNVDVYRLLHTQWYCIMMYRPHEECTY